MSNLVDVANAIREDEITVTTPFRYATICERKLNPETRDYTTASCMVLPTKYRNIQGIIAGLIAKDSVFRCDPSRCGKNWFDLQLCYDNLVIIIELHNYVCDEAEYWCSILDVPDEGIEYCLTNGIAAYFSYLCHNRINHQKASWSDYMEYNAGTTFKPFTTLSNTSEMSSYVINAWADEKFNNPTE